MNDISSGCGRKNVVFAYWFFGGDFFDTRTHYLYRHTLKHGVVLSQNWPGLTHSHKF